MRSNIGEKMLFSFIYLFFSWKSNRGIRFIFECFKHVNAIVEIFGFLDYSMNYIKTP